MDKKSIMFRISKVLAKKFKTKLVAKGQSAQEILEQAVIEYVK